MANFDIFYPILVENEGGYANVEGDTGGETYRGISRNNYPSWRGWAIVDSYKDNSFFPHILNVDTGLQTLVQAFYKPTFWDVIMGDQISNQSLANYIVDWGVNAGASVPVKHIQQILNVEVDGKFGPGTLAALNGADQQATFEALKAARVAFYEAVVKNHPTDRQFLSNWLERASSISYSD